MSTLISLGTDIGTLVKHVTEAKDVLSAMSNIIQTTADKMAVSNTNLASFVLECFTKSNLSDEKKAMLQSLFEKTFFSDNEQLIENLKTAKVNSDEALAAANSLIEALQKQLEQKDTQIAAQQTPRKSRRI
jgi:signal recognition particle GTPase